MHIVTTDHDRDQQVCDWWGINYYTRPAMNWCFQMGAGKDNEPVGDNGFRLYPQVSGWVVFAFLCGCLVSVFGGGGNGTH
jgi:hypothetical protein